MTRVTDREQKGRTEGEMRQKGSRNGDEKGALRPEPQMKEIRMAYTTKCSRKCSI